jgi:3-phenylpropionate/trans-cinnamate dioxygenase ferredoxin reductase component
MTTPRRNPAGVLVVGASQAGMQVAASLRDFGYPGPVTLVGAENHAPYQRPPLSKRGLLDTLTADSLHFRSPAFYESKGIDLALNRRITSIDKKNDGSGVAWSDRGEAFAFDRLALAVGARATQLPVPGNGLAGVVTLRSFDDALRLQGLLHSSRRVVIIGGGFIGLEVAATARQLGKDVSVVLGNDRLMARAVGGATSDFFHAAHLRRGVSVHLSSRPAAFLDDGTGSVGSVELEDGRRLPCDLVLVGIGAAPRTELAGQLGLEISDGIVVDENCVTSDGRTVAAGDCVSCPSPVDGVEGLMRFGSVNTAIEQAKVAAASLLGRPETYRSIPWFWSDQDSLKLQVAGLNTGHDRTVVRGTPEEEAFTVLYYRQDRLISAESVNRPADFMAARNAMNTGRTIDPERAAELSIPLKQLQRDLQPVGV